MIEGTWLTGVPGRRREYEALRALLHTLPTAPLHGLVVSEAQLAKMRLQWSRNPALEATAARIRRAFEVCR